MSNELDKIANARKANDSMNELIHSLEKARGMLTPFLCHDIGNGRCPDTDCWVQEVRSKQLDRIQALELALVNISGSVEITAAIRIATKALESRSSSKS